MGIGFAISSNLAKHVIDQIHLKRKRKTWTPRYYDAAY